VLGEPALVDSSICGIYGARSPCSAKASQDKPSAPFSWFAAILRIAEKAVFLVAGSGGIHYSGLRFG